MPFVSVKAVKGLMSDDEKSRMISKITDVVVEIAGNGSEDFRPGVWVVVEEIEASLWGAGGVPVDLMATRKITGRG